MRPWTRIFVSVVFIVALAGADQRLLNAVYMPFRDAAPVLRADPADLPPALRGRTIAQMQQAWPDWETAADRSIRQRLVEGEEDALAELLLFGTSFTDQPRATLGDVNSIGSGRPSRVIQARVMDLLSNLADPSGNERLVFSREMLLDKGYSFDSAASRQRIHDYLLRNLQRVRQEQQLYEDAVAAARQLSPVSLTTANAAPRSSGLVLSTSLLTNYGLERALNDMKERGLLAAGSVQRVAVLGPGLDFVDRQSGYDTYPEQTVQPFAVMDSLLRLKLAAPETLSVVTFDISARVNDHIEAARERAAQDRPYIIQLPRDKTAGWTAGAAAYWERFGEAIGGEATPARLPKEAKDITIRAVRVKPGFVNQVQPVDLDIVVQQIDVPTDSPPFDVIIATNVLNYYDTFQQNLALRNIARMLRPGGFLLCNHPIVQVGAPLFREAGQTFTQYSPAPHDTDRDFWYQRPK